LCVNKVCLYDWPPFPIACTKESRLMYHLNATNSIISMPRTLSSQCHELSHVSCINGTCLSTLPPLSSQRHELYQLNATNWVMSHVSMGRASHITNSIISKPRTESFLMHQWDVRLSITNCIISMSPSESCLMDQWDVHLTMTHFIISTLRTLLSQCHELCHLMRPRHTAMWISHILSSRTLSSQFHKMYHINVTNCII